MIFGPFQVLNPTCVAHLQRIQYAKTDSDIVSKMRGTYGDKEKKKEKKKKAQEQAANAAKKPVVSSHRHVRSVMQIVTLLLKSGLFGVMSSSAHRPCTCFFLSFTSTRFVFQNAVNNQPPPPATVQVQEQIWGVIYLYLILIHARVIHARLSVCCCQVPDNPPNYILFLTNLPEETNEMMLSMLFNQWVSSPRPRSVDREGRPSSRAALLRQIG